MLPTASKLNHVWLHQEVPLELLKKLKLPATDQGIDIVAETYKGEFWAIQPPRPVRRYAG